MSVHLIEHGKCQLIYFHQFIIYLHVSTLQRALPMCPARVWGDLERCTFHRYSRRPLTEYYRRYHFLLVEANENPRSSKEGWTACSTNEFKCWIDSKSALHHLLLSNELNEYAQFLKLCEWF